MLGRRHQRRRLPRFDRHRLPRQPCYWFENPKGDPNKHWAKHIIWHSACNETPQYADLFGTGKRVLIMGFQPKGAKSDNQGQMAYFTPGKDPNALWEMHPISEPSSPGRPPVPGTFHFSHGLGVGDINGDGRPDVMCTGGWWEQPAKVEDKPWKFHPANLGPACADMFAYDVDLDGKPDVVSSSATTSASGATIRNRARRIRSSFSAVVPRIWWARRTRCTASTSMATA